MFADRYFPDRYFARRYWPAIGDDIVVNPEIVALTAEIVRTKTASSAIARTHAFESGITRLVPKSLER